MNYILSYVYSSTNYDLMNINNIYNFINLFDILEDEQIKKVTDLIKINIGMTFYKSFRQYLFNKLPNSKYNKFLVE